MSYNENHEKFVIEISETESTDWAYTINLPDARLHGEQYSTSAEALRAAHRAYSNHLDERDAERARHRRQFAKVRGLI